MRSRKKTILLVAVMLAIAVVTTIATLRSGAQDKTVTPEPDIPTPIQEGVMTEKQKQHSRIFKGYKAEMKGKRLRDLVAQSGDVEVRREVGDVIRPTQFNLPQYLLNLTCKADAVVIGTVKSKASQLTDDGTFIFTDYELSVEEVLKNNPAALIQVGEVITDTRGGGTVKLNNHTVRALDENEMPLALNGRYLLFLRFVPATGSYMSSSYVGEDSFQFRGNQIAQVSGLPLPLRGRRAVDADSFMSEVRANLGQACKGGQ